MNAIDGLPFGALHREETLEKEIASSGYANHGQTNCFRKSFDSSSRA